MSNWINFTEQELMILDQVAKELEEFYVDTRKGIPQTKCVFEVSENTTWDDWEKEKFNIPVPEHLIGTWMMAYAGDLSYTNLKEAFKLYHWVKCKQEEIVTYEWVEL